MTLTQMEYIVAVAKEQNFHKAAASCHVTQPTLSALVKKLEEELEVVIFDRSKNPIVPTQLGQVIVDQAKMVLMEAKRVSEIVNLEKGETQGELRVGVIPTVAPYLLPLFLKTFLAKYPKVQLIISELTTENCLKALNNEEIDLAILATHENSKIYFQDHLYDEEMDLYIHPQHPLSKNKSVSVDDLRAEEMWLLEEGHCLRDEIIKICSLRKIHKNKPQGLDLKVGSLETLRLLVQENFGYTLLPRLTSLILPAKEKKLLRKLTNAEAQRSIFFTTKRRYLRQKLISVLREEVLKAVEKQMKSGL